MTCLGFLNIGEPPTASTAVAAEKILGSAKKSQRRTQHGSLRANGSDCSPTARKPLMTSLLTSQWLDACVVVPADDFAIITQLAAKAANEGQIIEDLSELRRYALNTHVDDAEASLVQSLQEKHRAIDAAATAAAEEDAARAAKSAADAELAAAEQKAHEAARRVAAAKAARATKAAAARRASAALVARAALAAATRRAASRAFCSAAASSASAADFATRAESSSAAAAAAASMALLFSFKLCTRLASAASMSVVNAYLRRPARSETAWPSAAARCASCVMMVQSSEGTIIQASSHWLVSNDVMSGLRAVGLQSDALLWAYAGAAIDR